MNYPKILVACPTSDYKLYCQDDWVKQICNLSYPNYDVLIVDNSKDEQNVNRLRSQFEKYKNTRLDNRVKVYHFKRLGGLKETIAESCNFIRDYMKEWCYDYLFMVESDIFIPTNSIEHLLAFKKKVICLPYFHFGGADTKLLQCVNYTMADGTVTQVFQTNEKCFIHDITGSNTPKRVYQTGLGCILIHVSVLKKVKFRYNKDEWELGFHDYFFHRDLENLKIPVYCDFNVIVEHRNNSKRWVDINKNLK